MFLLGFGPKVFRISKISLARKRTAPNANNAVKVPGFEIRLPIADVFKKVIIPI